MTDNNVNRNGIYKEDKRLDNKDLWIDLMST